ncbi:hypothetical protein GCM10023231_01860 [Olivibacter ginsenosidimutans]|uniref:SPFH domain-containing protein n=1 Tax=Olivibacter ginsenosidimutans TaxID=1176537 RepID=A0ABP9AEI8_9SPHI
MSIFNVFNNQLAQVIQWEQQAPELLWYRFPSSRNEVKNASKLIVAPGQGCVLVYEGKVADVIEEEGIFNLKTDNHPFITTLLNIRKNFESEHKLFVYFFRKADVLNQAWGTATPVKYVDGTYGIPISMGANGNFSYRISDVSKLFKQVIGNKPSFTTVEMKAIISNRIQEAIAAYLASKSYSFQEIDAQLANMAKDIQQQLDKEFLALGLNLLDLKISGTQFDEKTQSRIARVADVTTDVFAAKQAGLDYVDLEKLRALRDAARNEGGLAGAGLQLGAGLELGKKFQEEKEALLNKDGADVVEKLRKLQLLHAEGIITEEEFQAKKKELLANL